VRTASTWLTIGRRALPAGMLSRRTDASAKIETPRRTWHLWTDRLGPNNDSTGNSGGFGTLGAGDTAVGNWTGTNSGVNRGQTGGYPFYGSGYSSRTAAPGGNRSEVEVRLTPRAVEIFLKGERIAAHLRASSNHRHTTMPEHMPSSHRRYADWTVERIRREAASIGPATAALCELILERRPHPEQGFRACLGIVRLVRPFGADRLEAAATRAIEIGTLTYGSVRSILDNKLDRQTAQWSPADGVPILHPNIRGPRYYH
jgi:hypothetical protein